MHWSGRNITIVKEKNFEFLRGISCICIIVLHVSGWCYGEYGYGSEIDQYFCGATFFNVITRYAVPSFIMLTGAFTLNNPKNCHFLSYYKKVFWSTVLPTLSASVVYVLYTMLMKVVFGGQAAMDAALGSIKLWIIYGDPYGHMWYMYMLMGFLIWAPFLCRFYQTLTLPLKWIIGLVGVTIGCVWYGTGEVIWPLKFLQHIGFFFLGAVIREQAKTHKVLKVAKISGVVSVLILVLTYLLVYGQTVSLIPLRIDFQQRLSPTIIIGSVATFIWISNLKMNHNPVSKIAEHSFFVYLIHGGVISVIDNIWNDILHLQTITPWIYVPVVSLLTLVISYGVSIVLEKGYDRMFLEKRRR